jgi:uncharacterized protein YecE (DUF72 family)
VIEFRHISWWNPIVYEALAQHRVSFCSISHPQLPHNVIANTPVVYYRFHGVPHLYYSSYDTAFLQQITLAIKNANQVNKVFLYFNNTAQTAAIHNARFVIHEVGSTG